MNPEIVPIQAPIYSSQEHFQEQAITALMGTDITLTHQVLSQYPYPQAMEQLVRHLTSFDLAPTDRTHIIAQLHDLYYASTGDDLTQVAARQFSLYLLGSFASLESYFLLNHAWQNELHPWPQRAALLGSPTPAKYEEYLFKLDHDDRAREVARTFPRVFYGDQPPHAGLFQDDRKPNYSKTVQFYLAGYGRYLGEVSLGLVLYVIRDLIVTKGDEQLHLHPPLMAMLQQALDLQPVHLLAQREWQKLKLVSQGLKDKR